MSVQVAEIVTSVDLLNQNAAIGNTTLTTPPSDGMYRLTVHGSNSVAASAAVFHYYFTDDDAARSPSNGISSTSVALQQEYVFWAKSGIDIQYSVSIANGSPVYDLHLVLERLTPA